MGVQEVVAKRAGYKKTKLGWIPEDWTLSNLGSEIKFIGGNQPPRSTFLFEEKKGYVRLIQTRDYRTDKYKTYIKETDTNKFCKETDILIGRYGPPIFQIFRGLKGAYNVALIKAEIKGNSVLQNYLWYFLNRKNLRSYLESLSQRSGGQTGIEMDRLNKYDFPLPSLQEQKAIANCLSTWDKAIEKQSQLIQAKQTQKKALMQQLLTGKKRLPGFTEEWEQKSLAHFLEYFPRPITKPDIPFTKLGIRSHCKGTFQNKNFKPEDIAIDKLFRVKKNDLIVNITFAWEGAIAIVKQEDDEGLVSHRFPTYTFKKDIGNSLFFEQFIKTKRFRFLLELISPGGAGRNRVMSKKDFLKLKITIPKYKEQAAIANILNTADKEIALLQQQLTQLQQQKKGLMQQLLTGKKRLKY